MRETSYETRLCQSFTGFEPMICSILTCSMSIGSDLSCSALISALLVCSILINRLCNGLIDYACDRWRGTTNFIVARNSGL